MILEYQFINNSELVFGGWKIWEAFRGVWGFERGWVPCRMTLLKELWTFHGSALGFKLKGRNPITGKALGTWHVMVLPYCLWWAWTAFFSIPASLGIMFVSLCLNIFQEVETWEWHQRVSNHWEEWFRFTIKSTGDLVMAMQSKDSYSRY